MRDDDGNLIDPYKIRYRRKHALVTGKWVKARKKAIERDKSTCQACNKVLSTTEVTVDHIRPLLYGGDPYNLDNLQCLCRACHAVKTNEEQIREHKPNPKDKITCLECKSVIKGKKAFIIHLRKEHGLPAEKRGEGLARYTINELHRKYGENYLTICNQLGTITS